MHKLRQLFAGLQKTRPVALSLLITIAVSSCLFTNELGLRPVGALSGYETRLAIIDAGLVSYFLGDTLVDNEYSNQKANTALAKLFAGTLNGMLEAALLGIQDSRYYTRESVASCVENIHFKGSILVKIFIERYSRTIKDGGNSFEGIYTGQFFGPFLTVDSCNIKETGKVIHTGVLNL